jgi:hypothetical protein
MRSTGLFSLIGVAILAVVVAIFVSLGGGGGGGDPRVNQQVLPGIDKRLQDVAHLAIIKGDAKTTLGRDKDGVWTVAEMAGYRADGVKLRKILLGLAALRYAEPKTAKPDLYSRLDVENPGKKGEDSRLVTLSDGKGELLGELIVGKRRYDMFGGGNDGVYVRKPGEAQAWLAAGSLDMPSETLDWLDRNLTQIPIEKIKSATFIAADGAKVAIARAKAGDPFALEGGMPAGQKLKSEDGFNELARALSYFDLDEVKRAAELPFPDKGTASSVFTTFDGLTVTVTMLEVDTPAAKNAEKKQKHWVKITASGAGDAAKEADALNKKLGGWVYAVPDFKATTFATKLSDLIEPEKQS